MDGEDPFGEIAPSFASLMLVSAMLDGTLTSPFRIVSKSRPGYVRTYYVSPWYFNAGLSLACVSCS